MPATAEIRRPQTPTAPPKGALAVVAHNGGRCPFALFDRIANIGVTPAFLVAATGGLLHSFETMVIGGVALAVVAVFKVIGFVPLWLAQYRAKV